MNKSSPPLSISPGFQVSGQGKNGRKGKGVNELSGLKRSMQILIGPIRFQRDRALDVGYQSLQWFPFLAVNSWFMF